LSLSTLTVKSGCSATHFPERDCTGEATFTVTAHGWQRHMCEPAAKRLRKRMMAGALCPTCMKPKAWHWEMTEDSE
jgi:hypothetical protein